VARLAVVALRLSPISQLSLFRKIATAEGKRPAVDEATEEALYARLQERLPGLSMISVAHRATVAKFHHRRLTLHPETRSIEDGVVSPARYFGPGTGSGG
jgi:hypothetical protein